jgi:hypothetical protein
MNPPMQIYDIRYENFRRLVAEYGSLARLAKAADMNPSHLSQINIKHRPIGERLARRMEKKLKRPRGWFDQAQRTDEESALIMNYWKLSERGRHYVFELALWLAESQETGSASSDQVKMPKLSDAK